MNTHTTLQRTTTNSVLLVPSISLTLLSDNKCKVQRNKVRHIQCNTLQHSATQCNTVQHTVQSSSLSRSTSGTPLLANCKHSPLLANSHSHAHSVTSCAHTRTHTQTSLVCSRTRFRTHTRLPENSRIMRTHTHTHTSNFHLCSHASLLCLRTRVRVRS